MDRELITRLAREAGFITHEPDEWDLFIRARSDFYEVPVNAELTRFAALIAEECAKVCDECTAWSGGAVANLIRQKFSA